MTHIVIPHATEHRTFCGIQLTDEQIEKLKSPGKVLYMYRPNDGTEGDLPASGYGDCKECSRLDAEYAKCSPR